MEEKISSNAELNAEYKANKGIKTLGYKPNLMSLAGFINRAMNEPVDLDQLYTEISIGTSVNFKEEIYAIIPYERESAHTFIVYRDTAKLVELGTDAIAKKFLCHYWKMDFAGYKQTVENFLGYNAKNIPLACEEFSLMPFSISRDPDIDIWFNPGRIWDTNLISGKEKTIITLCNGFSFYLDRKGKSIYEQMYRAFIVHGILRRYRGVAPAEPTMGLLEYLDISSSSVTRKVTKGLEFRHIPGYEKDFCEIFLKLHDQFVKLGEKQRILSSLNISE
ncbi:competence protein ComK [Tetragenococcus koreensis]|uniref:Uncharacterized protein n=1 Tax=Tetragenococcus koreensis TaxID=290335 RepID=A0AAN4UCY2_9ENTE|nr:competence protein ComK [Tetragenococcus koreensis]MCF1628168.1 competence protein ComK [Tetragenococcus koreensis]GEQ50119.1 hypothetical protein TK11N_19710 [Tetragenococcus koreensis]GEQ52630.1 hypothetical protein TK12N_19740 [Tetragenococcus koreensis]GEQ55165.1 hypothetical protein TK2N_20090 [Tetragenococcus koreensis]GEQ57631.1 hypothetical protein TK4N_19740 [Tetragenococcus koreensis]